MKENVVNFQMVYLMDMLVNIKYWKEIYFLEYITHQMNTLILDSGRICFSKMIFRFF